jgi:hypothetical protein
MPRQNETMAYLIERLLETPQAERFLVAFENFLDRASGAFDAPAAAQRAAPHAENIPKHDVKVQDARATLLFGIDDPLSVERIKARRKELARVCHPDKGGSDEAMQAVNRAADVLIKALRGRHKAR